MFCLKLLRITEGDGNLTVCFDDFNDILSYVQRLDCVAADSNSREFLPARRHALGK